MIDSLKNTAQPFSGIPDIGVRTVLLVISILVAAVTILIVYSRMKEVDNDQETNRP